MQGLHLSSHRPPLNELLTLVVISHNRPAFLRRALRYYQTLPCRILVLDSSAEETTDLPTQTVANIDYQHLPQFGYWGMQTKLVYGVPLVTTPYMLFVADDDFILHDALQASVDFLEDNPDYGMCHGYCLMYLSLGKHVKYFRRDKRIQEDYGSDLAQERVVEFMGQFVPPFYAVTRTSLLQEWYATLPENTTLQWQEIGHTYFLLTSAKARVLHAPYVVREINVGSSEHNTAVSHSLLFTDEQSVREREAFIDFCASLPVGMKDLRVEQRRQVVVDAFTAMGECLRIGSSLGSDLIFDSTWSVPEVGPERRFGPMQFVEMPYYNQAFFDQLTEIEFFLHAMPAARVQLAALEGIWAAQEELLIVRANDTAETYIPRLWDAMQLNAFNRRVVKQLAHQLERNHEQEEALKMRAWAERLDTVFEYDSQKTFANMQSGRLLNWLASRTPSIEEQGAIESYLGTKGTPPQFGLLLLNLDNDIHKLQATLDSLVEGFYKGFKVVVFMTDEPPSATTFGSTLHFVKVTQSNYVEKLNQIARQLSTDWLMLAEAGDQFTAAGLLVAGLELLGAPECRAVCADEVHRQATGALRGIFRPGFNLDLLQSIPSLMARHWLVRRDVLIEAGGYSAEFTEALEFDLLLRIIQQGGLGWLAHLDEPLLICNTPSTTENTQERLALSRHLSARGYKAQITCETNGIHHIDYRHTERPLVSVILHGEVELEPLQRCVVSILQRTRYLRFEVLLASHQGMAPQMLEWLGQLEQPGGRVRVLEVEAGLSPSASCNVMAAQARGEYLLWLAADGEVVGPNWIGNLLNQAQRPEVGVVGARLTDAEDKITQAGLILGLNGGVGSPFIGLDSEEAGYMRRLQLTQNYSAVSAACLMVRKELFDEAGGFDESDFAQAFSDVDLCLNIGQLGFMTVWTPQAHICHSGVMPDAPQALAALKGKWAGQFEHDQAYNKNLSLTGEGFTLGEPSGVNWSQLFV